MTATAHHFDVLAIVHEGTRRVFFLKHVVDVADVASGRKLAGSRQNISRRVGSYKLMFDMCAAQKFVFVGVVSALLLPITSSVFRHASAVAAAEGVLRAVRLQAQRFFLVGCVRTVVGAIANFLRLDAFTRTTAMLVDPSKRSPKIKKSIKNFNFVLTHTRQAHSLLLLCSSRRARRTHRDNLFCRCKVSSDRCTPHTNT